MMKEQETRKGCYEQPQLTVVQFRTELGFATSTTSVGGGESSGTHGLNRQSGGGYWGSSGSNDWL